MSEDVMSFGKHPLEPMERISEILFGLIMVLTITCSFSIAGAGRTEVRQMLIGALGCNLAWGIIDAVMYLMECFSARGQGIQAVRAVRRASEPRMAHRVIAGAMPPLLASVMSPEQLEDMRVKLSRMPEPPLRPQLSKSDWLGSLGVCLLVVIATFPVIVPFIFVSEPMRALRISNAVAIGMLFVTGFEFGRCSGHRPLATGISMVIVGSILVGLTIVLGG